MSLEEILKEIETLSDYYKEEGQRLVRLIKMYPPDGGGRASEARYNQKKAIEKIESLKKIVDIEALENKKREIQIDEAKELLLAGYSTKEIARKLGLLRAHHIIPEIDIVVFYENWDTIVGTPGNRAVVDREVLVCCINNKFEVRYYSMTDTGRHSRLVASKQFTSDHEAIKYAKELRKRNS